MTRREEGIVFARGFIKAGGSERDLIAALKAEGFYIMDSIVAVRLACGISLGEAKHHVSDHPAWDDQRAGNARFHDKLIHVLEIAQRE